MFIPVPAYAARYGISRKHAWHLASRSKVPSQFLDGAWLLDANVAPPKNTPPKTTGYTVRVTLEEELAMQQKAAEAGLEVGKWLRELVRGAVA